MTTLHCYNTPFNNNGRVQSYVNGTKPAGVLFNIKAGSWVLKKTANGYTKCKLCGDNDNEIHRIIECKPLRDFCQEMGLNKVLSNLRTPNQSKNELIRALTMGSKDDCLERGKILLLIDNLLEKMEG